METTQFDVRDFRNAKYNVLAIGKQKVINSFPYLKKFPEFNNDYKEETGIENDMIFRYMLLMYTDNIIRTIPDLYSRKKESALLAGFSRDEKTNKFSPEVEKMLICEYDVLNDLIIRVGRINHNHAFMQLIVFEETRAKEMAKLSSGSNDNNSNIFKSIRDLTSSIKDLEKELLSGDDNINLIDRLYIQIEDNQLGIRPEEIAKSKKDGSTKELLGNKYEKEVDIEDVPDMR
jgi:hypothetical protein